MAEKNVGLFFFNGQGRKIGISSEVTVCSVSMTQVPSGWLLLKSPSTMK